MKRKESVCNSAQIHSPFFLYWNMIYSTVLPQFFFASIRMESLLLPQRHSYTVLLCTYVYIPIYYICTSLFFIPLYSFCFCFFFDFCSTIAETLCHLAKCQVASSPITVTKCVANLKLHTYILYIECISSTNFQTYFQSKLRKIQDNARCCKTLYKILTCNSLRTV